jgi:hypothetical protein
MTRLRRPVARAPITRLPVGSLASDRAPNHMPSITREPPTRSPRGPRRIENPVQGDAVTFLETSEESGGERTLIELEAAPAGSLHRWGNLGSERCLAQVELRPGRAGFEAALCVGYALANEGRVLKDGTPRNPLYTALLLEWSEIRLPGVYAALERVLRLSARIARRRGVDRRLARRYGL